ncbi:hypothetical protein VOLCADRAFT_105830 [Volvox carteri f. nagariensis]|uniref:Uncharacterized protein n=1 Tax=Volvox carteri f. nagariensis TaxID=3068 RepID=D8U3F2_VOLCA|nr:uncharacterized protein VOLCADRAFT_105830 [Volvox carteri f. nagariensis]EFJ45815.1 hypothetical protein VOLCADRAFT_105830 [Volvox carteri f. nagariensis]|eukprot:XP_002953216.1 hypothetical protein VOLCADRAFT_105830 [Volvox carteri f. nagariensis]
MATVAVSVQAVLAVFVVFCGVAGAMMPGQYGSQPPSPYMQGLLGGGATPLGGGMAPSAVPRAATMSGAAVAGPDIAAMLLQMQQDLAGVRARLNSQGQDHSARLEQIAAVIVSRVGSKTWQSYASHFAAFVRFCVSEDLEFLPASRYTGLLWAQYLAARGSVRARTAQPYFSAVNTVHVLLGLAKPCDGDNVLLSAFRKGWERLQVSLAPTSSLVLAFSASDAWRLYDRLPSVPVASDLFVPLLFVVLGFCLFLRPDSLLSVVWARVSVVDEEPVFQYKPLHWKGRITAPELAPVLQFPLGGLPFLRVALLQKLSRDPARLWPERQTTQGAERWFDRVLAQCGLEGLRSVHTLYSCGGVVPRPPLWQIKPDTKQPDHQPDNIEVYKYGDKSLDAPAYANVLKEAKAKQRASCQQAPFHYSDGTFIQAFRFREAGHTSTAKPSLDKYSSWRTESAGERVTYMCAFLCMNMHQAYTSSSQQCEISHIHHIHCWFPQRGLQWFPVLIDTGNAPSRSSRTP